MQDEALVVAGKAPNDAAVFFPKAPARRLRHAFTPPLRTSALSHAAGAEAARTGVVCRQSPDLKDAPARATSAVEQTMPAGSVTLPQYDSDPEGRQRELAAKREEYVFSRETLPQGTPMLDKVPPADLPWALFGAPPEQFVYKAGWLWKARGSLCSVSMSSDSFPSSSSTSPIEQAVVTTALRTALDMIPAPFRGTTRDGLRGLAKIGSSDDLNVGSSVVGSVVDIVRAPLADLGREAKGEAAPADAKGATRAKSLRDYADIFGPMFKTPISAAPHGISDNAFTWYRIAGPNPNAIHKCKKSDRPGVLEQLKEALATPQHSKLRGELSELLDAGELYKVDYTMYEGTSTGENEGPVQYMPSPLALFRLNRDPEARKRMPLEPVLIQVEAHSKDVFQPPADQTKDSPELYRWLMAKACVQVADGCHHEVLAHLGRTHLVMESFAGGLHRQLSERHPLYRLLSSHFQGTLNINNLSRFTLINKSGIVDVMMAPCLEEVLPSITNEVKAEVLPSITSAVKAEVLPSITSEVKAGALPSITSEVRAWKARDFSFDAVLESQGMRNQANEFPHLYPYRDDAAMIWAAIKKWVSLYIDVYYKDAQAVERDTELNAFIAELGAHDVKWLEKEWGARGTDNELVPDRQTNASNTDGYAAGVGEDAKVKHHTGTLTSSWAFVPFVQESLQLLKKLVSTIIFTTSAQHAAVNFPQSNLMSYVPGFPLSMYMAPPTSEMNPNLADYVSLFAPMEVAKTQKNVGVLLGNVRHTRLGHYDLAPFLSHFGGQDAHVQSALSRFRQDLDGIKQAIDARNQELVGSWVAAGTAPSVAECYAYDMLRPDRVPQSINI
ncbi:lipoxygenase [Tribonema minus]|uniref:Lipoxygenase n=1 Tax=Tribonema minus TaxID=303371 RepID=A0A836CMV5_9STRA|nr:lipoxygenase [Tribonema minus]